MSVFTDCLVAKASTHSEALECISGNGVPACTRRSQGVGKRLGESEAATSWCLFPSSSVPPGCSSSPELISDVIVEFGLLWITCGAGGGGGAGRDAVGWNEREGGPRVTGADPPSLTVRTPSPRPLHLRSDGRGTGKSSRQVQTTRMVNFI